MSLLDLAPVIDALSTHTLTISRGAPSYASNGRLVPAPVLPTVTVRASVQPLTGRDLAVLPEGYRESEPIAVFTRYRLQNGDTFQLDGEAFKVMNVERWGAAGNFVRATAAKAGPE